MSLQYCKIDKHFECFYLTKDNAEEFVQTVKGCGDYVIATEFRILPQRILALYMGHEERNFRYDRWYIKYNVAFWEDSVEYTDKEFKSKFSIVDK